MTHRKLRTQLFFHLQLCYTFDLFAKKNLCRQIVKLKSCELKLIIQKVPGREEVAL